MKVSVQVTAMSKFSLADSESEGCVTAKMSMGHERDREQRQLKYA